MKYIFIGNPGTGKSTLVNALIGEVKFMSGISFGAGKTTHLQSEIGKDGVTYMDTPGLSDVELRKQAGKEIIKALRSGYDDYKLIFVVTEESGRVRPADGVTMKLVLDCLEDSDQTEPIPYGIIVNKMTKRKIAMLNEDDDKMNNFICCINQGHAPTSHVYFNEHNADLEDEENQLVHPSPDLKDFVNSQVPHILIDPVRVKEVNTEEYDEMVERHERIINVLLNDREKMKEEHERQLAELRRNEGSSGWRKKFMNKKLNCGLVTVAVLMIVLLVNGSL